MSDELRALRNLSMGSLRRVIVDNERPEKSCRFRENLSLLPSVIVTPPIYEQRRSIVDFIVVEIIARAFARSIYSFILLESCVPEKSIFVCYNSIKNHGLNCYFYCRIITDVQKENFLVAYFMAVLLAIRRAAL